ncbi:MAG: GxxExxY protein [Pyrinomonadaceae bacterium]
MLVKPPNENDPRRFAIIGAAMEVHKQLDCGFLEAVYQEPLAIEFSRRNIPLKRTIAGNQLLGRLHLLRLVIAELKAVAICGTEESQVINYLKR